MPARLFPEIRFRGYPKESMRIGFSEKGISQKGDEPSSFVPRESTTNRVMEFLWVVYLSRE